VAVEAGERFGPVVDGLDRPVEQLAVVVLNVYDPPVMFSVPSDGKAPGSRGPPPRAIGVPDAMASPSTAAAVIVARRIVPLPRSHRRAGPCGRRGADSPPSRRHGGG
jgi:hypothetical protein